MRIGPTLTYRQRLQLAGALALAGIIALAATCGCLPTGHSMLPATRTVNQQFRGTVKITVMCLDMQTEELSGWYGSGVMVTPHRILTAAHVARCNGIEMIGIDPGDGEDREATVELLANDRDLASLNVDGLESFFTPVSIAEAPGLGGKVCESFAMPRWGYRCGTIQPHSGDKGLYFDLGVEHGQSGSGLYDSWGRLIGIVVQLEHCTNDDVCGGVASPLYGLSWPLE